MVIVEKCFGFVNSYNQICHTSLVVLVALDLCPMYGLIMKGISSRELSYHDACVRIKITISYSLLISRLVQRLPISQNKNFSCTFGPLPIE